MPNDTRDMVIRLERDVKNLTETVENLTESVQILNNLLERSRGAVLVLTIIGSVIGFCLAKASMVLGWFGYALK